MVNVQKIITKVRDIKEIRKQMLELQQREHRLFGEMLLEMEDGMMDDLRHAAEIETKKP